MEAWLGVDNNPDVMKYFHETGYTFIDEDETPWCAAFLNWICQKCDIATPNKLNARSFLQVGEVVTVPSIGDIVVLWRLQQNGPYGHCGIFIRETPKMVYVLGGNQDSRVSIKAFPKTQLLGYRKV